MNKSLLVRSEIRYDPFSKLDLFRKGIDDEMAVGKKQYSPREVPTSSDRGERYLSRVVADRPEFFALAFKFSLSFVGLQA